MKEPLVTVIVPVYNGAAYLRECLDSVLAQTYREWHMVVLNNSSTDESGTIAAEYAQRDPRVTVQTTERLLPIIENHNRALSFLDPEAKYCKPLMADDWLMPQCISEMVALAERNPTVGQVGAYAFDGSNVMWSGPPFPAECISGHEVCRAALLGGPYWLGTPSTSLIRADLMRKRAKFYNESNVNADLEASYEVLSESNFGFVHQVLAYNRVHERSMTSSLRAFDGFTLGTLHALKRCGRAHLSESEFTDRVELLLYAHYRMLAKNALRLRERGFWEQQRKRLETIGEPLNRRRLTRAVAAEVLRRMRTPFAALDSAVTWWSAAGKRARGRRRSAERSKPQEQHVVK